MANIVVSMYSYLNNKKDENNLPPFYEGFINGLKENGNNVLCYYHNSFDCDFEKNIPEEILCNIKLFNPNIFIFFNNNFWDITKQFDCPIIIYDVDSPNLYANKEKLSKNLNRYKFIVNQSSGIKLIKDFGVNEKSVIYVKPFTSIRAEKKEKINNIAFCGSHWLWNGCEFVHKFLSKKPVPKDLKYAQEALRIFKNKPFLNTREIYREFENDAFLKVDFNNMRLSSGRLSGIKRARILTEISDLGLEIRGDHWDHPSLNYFPEIALCYNSRPVHTLQETQNLYNSSKIGFNVNHIQAKTGFSWRVCDILASSACLVTEYTSDIKELFPNIPIPTYTSKSEAREQCIYILNNEHLREDIIGQVHEVIEKNHRFKNTLEAMESFIGIKLKQNQEGELEIISLSSFLV